MKYKKNDLKEIISKGSLKRRLVLWFNHAHAGKDPLLSNEEERALLDSFKVNNEEKIAFNEWEDKRIAFGKMVDSVDSLRRTYRFHLARLTSFTMLLHSYELMESTLNDILYLLKNKPEKEEILKLLNGKYIPLAGIKEEKGYIKLEGAHIEEGSRAYSERGIWIKGENKPEGESVEEEESLTNERGDLDVTNTASISMLKKVLLIEKVYSTRAISSFKGGFEALKEIMEEEGFKSQFHTDLFKEWEEEANDYQGFHTSQNPKRTRSIPNSNPKLREILDRFESNLYPVYGDIEGEEAFYKHTKDNYKIQAKL